ncbi:MAG TPA: 5-bromo-4-chloroindolyl phosphate hydrolysis family protein [Candidatus Gemmiger excrementipullorum]|uniref:5-bromo-4-chloroindolyl phosphate hydrolysis family protein n=1 Tax=Candidatus Gemmiger excrementipullorum TaxID=2838610 RepID=A0A9D1XZV8_9FIRM|nr:5-bromo-4-chloroindolyl phosphate hydrolysis family protein [Candidatus Gemmiger excrementipullorum]
MSKWEEKQVRPVLPLYLAGAGVLAASLVFPPYTLGSLAVVAVAGAAAGLAGRALCPVRVVRTLVPYATGSEDVDAMLTGIAADLDRLHALNDAIPDQELSAAMDRMEKAGRRIVDVVEKDPEKARMVDRFARYYLPESLKLMSAYAELEKNGVQGENAAQITRELRQNAGTTATAFETLLDSLYSDEALNISTDIEVLDSILKSQDLAK